MTDIQNISAASAGEAVDEELIEQAYEMMAGGQPAGEKPEQTGGGKWQKWKANFKRRGWILLFILPALIYVIIFCYVPMYGILVAFQDYMPGDPIIGEGTAWVGWETFQNFFANRVHSRVSPSHNSGAAFKLAALQKSQKGLADTLLCPPLHLPRGNGGHARTYFRFGRSFRPAEH